MRIGKRWFSTLWLLPVGAAGLIIGIAVCQQLRTVLMIAVVLMIGQGIAINRLASLPYPLWSPRHTAR